MVNTIPCVYCHSLSRTGQRVHERTGYIAAYIERITDAYIERCACDGEHTEHTK